MRRRGRPVAALVLTDEETTTLERWARRPTTAQAVAQRARMILLCAGGANNGTVARRLQVTRQTVGRWRARFIADRLEGLLDEPRPGAPRTIRDADVERVITRTLESTPRDATHWSTRAMAKASGLSQSAISRIWRAFALQPHRTETFKLSKDPLFIEKVRDIVGLYLHPPDRALVCAWTRNRRSRRWTALSPSCRCARAKRNVGRTTTPAMAPPRCLPR